MRGLRRNETVIYFANFSVSETDEWGNEAQGYGAPRQYRIAVSAETGGITQNAFGDSLNYSRQMITHNMDCPINENSRLWINNDVSQPHDYKVARVSRSLNCIVYLIERVNVS